MNKLFIVTLLFVPLAWLIRPTFQISKRQNYPFQKVQQSKEAGEKVFKKYCISCHMVDGSGVPHLNPPLIQTKYILGDKPTLIKIILNGLENVEIEGDTYTNKMPPLKSILKDQQIADVLTYVRNSFGNKASAVSAADVKIVRNTEK